VNPRLARVHAGKLLAGHQPRHAPASHAGKPLAGRHPRHAPASHAGKPLAGRSTQNVPTSCGWPRREPLERWCMNRVPSGSCRSPTRRHSLLTGPRLGTARVCVSVILPGRCLSKITDNVITHRVRVRGSTSARQSWLYREPRRLGDYFDGGPRPTLNPPPGCPGASETAFDADLKTASRLRQAGPGSKRSAHAPACLLDAARWTVQATFGKMRSPLVSSGDFGNVWR